MEKKENTSIASITRLINAKNTINNSVIILNIFFNTNLILFIKIIPLKQQFYN